MLNRRQLFGSAAAVAGIAALNRSTALAQAAEKAAKPHDGKSPWMRDPHPEPGEAGKHYKPTVTLNGTTLPWKL
ncbi:MAG TPA: copper oxidase, partial [Chthoniobacteraceae bacterium]|nr:copper oxidase [Chthoniobacteraceae bacterium]